MFAFLPFIIGGDGAVMSVEAAIRRSARRRMRLAVPAPADESAAVSAKVGRRALVQTGAVAVLVGVAAVIMGGIGRAVAGTSADTTAAAPQPASGAPSAAPQSATSGSIPPGASAIGTSAELPVGGSLAFSDASGNPGFALQPKAGTYLAYSAVCTHQGCTVGYDQGVNQFACPCHGALFSGASGDVVRGPARDPLQKYTIAESGGTLYVA
jgi:Rieske Fe-S protein